MVHIFLYSLDFFFWAPVDLTDPGGTRGGEGDNFDGLVKRDFSLT